jgi:hypothetical protein
MVGAVVSVDREKGEVEVRPLPGFDKSEDTQGDTIKIKVSPDLLQGYVRDGARVRIWGDFSPGAQSDFSITPLRGGPHPQASGPDSPPPPPDPTGVRSRISHGLRRPGGSGPSGGPPRPGGGRR